MANFNGGNNLGTMITPHGQGYGQYPVCVSFPKQETDQIDLKVTAGDDHQAIVEETKRAGLPTVLFKIYRAFSLKGESVEVKDRLLSSFETYRTSIAVKVEETAEKGTAELQIEHHYCSFDLKFTTTEPEEIFIHVTTVGGYNTRLFKEWLVTLCKNVCFWSMPENPSLHLVPDVFELEGEEFERIKEQSRELWEESLNIIRPQLSQHVEFAQPIMNKRMAGDENSRTSLKKILDFSINFDSFSEYDFHFDYEQPQGELKELLCNVAYGVRLHAYYQFRLRKVFGLYQGKNLDAQFRHSTHKFCVQTFDYSMRLRMQEDKDRK